MTRYETLFNVKLKDMVKFKDDDYLLGQLLKEVNYNNCLLFLAAEQGAGRYENDMHIVVNPRVKVKAKQWILDVHPKVKISDNYDNKTLI